jgi:hypothetical protein
MKSSAGKYYLTIKGYDNIDKGCCKYTSIRKLPRKVRQHNDFWRRKRYQNVYNMPECGYDKKTKHGYALFQYLDSSATGFSTACILFEIENGKAYTDVYHIEGKRESWSEARPFLDEKHHGLFHGWIMTEKESKRCYRNHQIKKFFHIK